MEKHLISIIIVNYRNYGKLRDCLTSVNSSLYSNLEIVVVDNSSDELELERVRRDFKSAKFFTLKGNLNYAEGNNFGFSRCSGDFIVILNNDTVVEENWLEPLVNAATLNPCAFYQPKILFLESPDVVNSLGNTVHVLGFAFPLGINSNVSASSQSQEITEVFYCSGACIFVSRNVLEKLGGFDSNYWTYYEDVNLGWRGKLLGFRSYVVPSSTIYHSWGATHGQKLTPAKLYLLERGRLSSLLRNYSLRSLLILIPFIFLLDLFLFIYLIPNKGMAIAKWKASISLLKAFRILLSQRKGIQSLRVINDGELSKFLNHSINHPYLENMPKVPKAILENLSRLLIRCL